MSYLQMTERKLAHGLASQEVVSEVLGDAVHRKPGVMLRHLHGIFEERLEEDLEECEGTLISAVAGRLASDISLRNVANQVLTKSIKGYVSQPVAPSDYRDQEEYVDQILDAAVNWFCEHEATDEMISKLEEEVDKGGAVRRTLINEEGEAEEVELSRSAQLLGMLIANADNLVGPKEFASCGLAGIVGFMAIDDIGWERIFDRLLASQLIDYVPSEAKEFSAKVRPSTEEVMIDRETTAEEVIANFLSAGDTAEDLIDKAVEMVDRGEPLKVGDNSTELDGLTNLDFNRSENMLAMVHGSLEDNFLPKGGNCNIDFEEGGVIGRLALVGTCELDWSAVADILLRKFRVDYVPSESKRILDSNKSKMSQDRASIEATAEDVVAEHLSAQRWVEEAIEATVKTVDEGKGSFRFSDTLGSLAGLTSEELSRSESLLAMCWQGMYTRHHPESDDCELDFMGSVAGVLALTATLKQVNWCTVANNLLCEYCPSYSSVDAQRLLDASETIL